MEITGKTALIFMLTDPVEHVRGTIIVNKSFEALGVDAVFAPLHVRPADLASSLEALRRMLNVVGLGITAPHKIAVIPHLEHMTEVARRVGAVNAIRFNADRTLTGTNTDGAGFIAGLAANNISVAGRRALIVGAGGVARAIAFALADEGLVELVLANRNTERAVALAAEIAAVVPSCRTVVRDANAQDVAAGMDLVVNATSLGMKEGDPMPFSIAAMEPAAIVAEVVVNPVMTPLLLAAAERGHAIVSGAEMLKPQPRLEAEFLGLLPNRRG